jgi:transcriptional regulator with XRE-family HTH domain
MVRRRRPSAVYDPEYRYVIRRVREAREAAGMTLKDVAAALERPVSFVSKCELGERRIDPVDLRKFADLFDKPLEFFYPKRARKGRPKPSGSTK